MCAWTQLGGRWSLVPGHEWHTVCAHVDLCRVHAVFKYSSCTDYTDQKPRQCCGPAGAPTTALLWTESRRALEVSIHKEKTRDHETWEADLLSHVRTPLRAGAPSMHSMSELRPAGVWHERVGRLYCCNFLHVVVGSRTLPPFVTQQRTRGCARCSWLGN